MAAVHPLILADVEGWVEEDVQEINHYLHSAVERRMKTTCTWASLYTDANRLLPIPARAKWSSESEGAQRPSPLAVLCDEFPELFSDPNVWKLLCALSWPGCKRSQLAAYGGSWRAMYITRPRPRMDGFYVVKWSTHRHGRNEGRGMKDAGKDYYKPAIITLMYKVLLFQTGGNVLTMTTSIEHTSPDKLLRRVRRSEMKLSSKRVQDKRPEANKNCDVSVAGVVRGRYVLKEDRVELTFLHVPEDNPRMIPINTQYSMCLCSRSTASNDILTTLRYTTGSEENGFVDLDLPPRPFRFLPFESFASKMADVEGWPDCYVGQPLDLTQ